MKRTIALALLALFALAGLALAESHATGTVAEVTAKIEWIYAETRKNKESPASQVSKEGSLEFWSLVNKIQQVISDIADDPEGFINNLVSAIGQGFQQFFDNILSHLLKGFIDWLFDGLTSVGVEIPSDLSLKSLITFFLQLMGITWARIRQVLARHIGEENVALIEKAYELIATLIEQGPEGRLLRYDRDHPDGEVIMMTHQGKVDSYGFELHDFALAVLEGKPLEAPPEFSLGELRTALAMYRSVESGRWEKVWD